MLYSILKKMEERPGLYGCESVDDILIYLEGYSQALWEFKIVDEEYQFFVENFTNYVKKYHRIKIHHPNWATLIRFYSVNQHESLTNFFRIFNEFIEKKLNKKVEN